MKHASRFLRWTILAVALVAALNADAQPPSALPYGGPSLTGRLLVATPTMSDSRFAETVIFIADHDADGALGFIVNRSGIDFSLKALFETLGMEVVPALEDVSVRFGGPVFPPLQPWVLHSTDWKDPETLVTGTPISVSKSVRLLRAIAGGEGPKQAVVLLGYAGWGPGQLENELARDSWLVAPLDVEMVFGTEHGAKWRRALARAGFPI